MSSSPSSPSSPSQAVTDFLEPWTARMAAAIAAELRDAKPDLDGQDLYVVALTVDEGNAAPVLSVSTEEHLDELFSDDEDDLDEGEDDASDDDDDEVKFGLDADDLDDNADARWWPDEWDWSLDRTIGETAAELDGFVREHPELARADGDVAGGSVSDAGQWSQAWLDATTDALCAALGADEVRAVLDAMGQAPVLYVTTRDGEASLAVDTLERLNVGRDDERLRDARDYWSAHARRSS